VLLFLITCLGRERQRCDILSDLVACTRTWTRTKWTRLHYWS